MKGGPVSMAFSLHLQHSRRSSCAVRSLDGPVRTTFSLHLRHSRRNSCAVRSLGGSVRMTFSLHLPNSCSVRMKDGSVSKTSSRHLRNCLPRSFCAVHRMDGPVNKAFYLRPRNSLHSFCAVRMKDGCCARCCGSHSSGFSDGRMTCILRLMLKMLQDLRFFLA